MNKSILYILTLIGLVLTSCVPTKDMIYLQKNSPQENQVVTPSPQKPYRLQTNDILNINIKSIDNKLVEAFNYNNQSQLSNSTEGNYFNGYSIDDHGNIRLPILGEINVLGFTIEDVRKKIEKQLLEQYFNTEAGIFVNVKLAGFRYTINGEVASTGTKTLYQDRVNIMEAIANAGDITVVGDRKDVKVFRSYPQGTETLSINLTDISALNSPAYYLQPNDHIYVKPLKQKSWGTGKTGIESLSTIITILTLATTTFLLLK